MSINHARRACGMQHIDIKIFFIVDTDHDAQEYKKLFDIL
jgi:hypothetical protein